MLKLWFMDTNQADQSDDPQSPDQTETLHTPNMRPDPVV